MSQRGFEHEDEDFISPIELAKQSLMGRLSRREILRLTGGIGLLGALTACGASGFEAANVSSGNGSTTVGDGSCSIIPSETDGPYPLYSALSNLYRTDIIGNDIANSSGVPLNIVLNLKNTADACAPIAGAAVYIWHCDQSGGYSGYSSSQNGYHAGKTFCRGIAISDVNGQVAFQTLYPGWYSGRITHVHLAVYLNNGIGGSAKKVSQLAFPQEITREIYGTIAPYSTKGQNTSVSGFNTDGIFADGVTQQLAAMTGSIGSGLTATLDVGVSA